MTSVTELGQVEEWDEICRLCLTKDKSLYPIFPKLRSTDRRIHKKIEECCPVLVYLGDPLPKNICKKCLFKLDLFVSFRRCCDESEKKLTEYIKTLKRKSFDQEEYLEAVKHKRKNNELSSDENKLPTGTMVYIPDAFFEVRGESAQSLDKSVDLQVEGLPSAEVNTTMICETSKTGWHSYFEKYLRDAKSKIPVSPQESQKCIVSSEVVPQKSSEMIVEYGASPTISEEGISLEEDSNILQEKCVGNGTRINIEEKLEHVENGNNLFKCNICDLTCSSKNSLIAHQNVHWKLCVNLKEGDLLKCSLCGKGFANQYMLNRHNIFHITKKISTYCSENSLSVLSNQNQSVPEEKENDDPNNENVSEGLKIRDISTDNTPKVCRINLNKELQLSTIFKKKVKKANKNIFHKVSDKKDVEDKFNKMENIDNLLPCSFCDKKFKYYFILNKHLEKHLFSVVKDKTCAICDQTFHSNFLLSKHMLKHKKSNPKQKCFQELEIKAPLNTLVNSKFRNCLLKRDLVQKKTRSNLQRCSVITKLSRNKPVFNKKSKSFNKISNGCPKRNNEI